MADVTVNVTNIDNRNPKELAEEIKRKARVLAKELR